MTDAGRVPRLAQPWLTVGNRPSAESITVGQYETIELVFDVSEQVTNPFDTYLLKLAVRDPQGQTLEVEGFYDGDGLGGQSGNVWKARLAPYALGTWQWWTIPGDAPAASLEGLSGAFEVVASGERGGLVAQGQHFSFQSGEPFYLVGNFLDLYDGPLSTHVYMSEVLDDDDRATILARQRDLHQANKANIYFANQGDYGWLSVTPWLGTADNNDKSQMDLARWRRYDGYLEAWRQAGMLTEMWFFADDSNFGHLAESDQRRLMRYAMARTSGMSQTLYVLALEWGETFSAARINSLGEYFQTINPWGRLVSVHNHTDWAFGEQAWPSFIATQAGNSSTADKVNQLARSMRASYGLPHLDEEYGGYGGTSADRTRGNLWANLCGGAAGGGTGSDLAALQHFLAQSGLPWQRMSPANDLVSGGDTVRFCLAEPDHHYLVYSLGGGFDLMLSGTGLEARWFDPRGDAWATQAVPVAAGSHTWEPPADVELDWVLWVSDGSQLNNGVTHPAWGADLAIQQSVTTAPGSVTLALTVTNAGPLTAYDVCLSDALPEAILSPQVSSAGATFVPQVGERLAWCLAEPLSLGQTAQVTITGQCVAAGPLTNTVAIWWPHADFVQSNNSSTTLIYPEPAPVYLPHLVVP